MPYMDVMELLGMTIEENLAQYKLRDGDYITHKPDGSVVIHRKRMKR